VAKKVSVSARVIDDFEPSTDEFGQSAPTVNDIHSRDTLYTWYWRSPEIRAIISAIIADTFGEGYGFDGSEARVKKVKNFARSNKFNAYSKAMLRDALLSGDGYLGKAALTESDIAAAMTVIYEDYMHKDYNSVQPDTRKNIMNNLLKIKPDLYSPRVLFPLMSRSIEIQYTQNGKITGYIQRAKSQAQGIVLDPDEVIHYAYEPVGDQIYGVSPLQTAIYDTLSLYYAKSYGGMFFQNDATPNFIFSMEEESPDSQNYKNFLEQLRKFKKNPHNNVLTTGKVGVTKVASLNKDMEFSTFIDKFTQHLTMAYGASARFTHLFGKAESPSSLEAYYKHINSIQSDLEDLFNDELFSYFDVEFYFNRFYKRDESKEADVVTKLTNLAITVNEAREYLGYKPKPNTSFDEIQTDAYSKPQGKDEVASADSRTEQNAVAQTGPGRRKEQNE